MPFSAWILALLAVPPAPDEFHERCAALSSPVSVERAAAERWLAAHLGAERYPDLVALARGADAEVRARLVRILAADPRHLELALALATERGAELSELGLEALRANLIALEPSLGEPPRRGAELRSTLERLAGSGWPRQVVLDSGRPFGEIALELELSGVLGVGLVLDPALATRVARDAPEVFVGPWEEALDSLLRSYDLSIEGHGLPRGREADTRIAGFLRVFAGENERPRRGVEPIVDWLLVLARSGEEGARVQAARNLAAVDLAPVLAWLGRRALEGDAAALEGMLLAGARGRIAAPLFGVELFERLLADATRGGRRSALTLAALSALPNSPERRAALHARLAGTPAEQWVALWLAERLEAVDGRVLEHARGLLGAAETAPALRLQALHTYARLAPEGSVAPAVAGRLELLRLPVNADERVRLARTLAVLGIEPPARDPGELTGTESGFELALRVNLIEAWAWNGSAEGLGAHLANWVVKAGADEPRLSALLAEVLAPAVARGDGARLRRALAEGRRLAPDATRALERLELLLALVEPQDVTAVLERGGWLLSGPSADLALLGALAGYPRPIAAEGPAREALHGALASARSDQPTRAAESELFAALARAAGGLYAAGRDEEGDAFSARVRSAARKWKGDFKRRVELGLWPPVPMMSARDLRAEFEARTLPAGL